MTSLEKLKAVLPAAPDGLLEVLLEDAEASVKIMTRREDVSGYEPGIRAVAVQMYNRLGREGETSHSAGGVSIAYAELPDAVKHLLPLPLVSAVPKRKDGNDVETEPQV